MKIQNKSRSGIRNFDVGKLMHFLRKFHVNSDSFHSILSAYTQPRIGIVYIESDFLVKMKRRVGRKSEALISAVGTLCSFTSRHTVVGTTLYWASPKTQNNRPRPTEFLGRKQRRHYNIPTPLYHEIGLLKNYAESRGPIRAIIP